MQPKETMANLGNVLILPTLKIHELQEQVEKKTAGRKEFTNIERSEALESLGIAQFYNGDYAEAISNLEGAIAPRYIKIKAKRRVAIIKTLVSIAPPVVSSSSIISNVLCILRFIVVGLAVLSFR